MSDYAVYEGKLVPVDELMHHGIKGMKWGVRRYQNPDGSLTSDGRKRYGYGTLDEEGKAAYKSYKKTNNELANQATRKAAVGGALLGGAAGLALGGPVGGLVGMVGSMAASSVATASINSGKNFIDNKKYKKALIKQADQRRDQERDKENAKEKSKFAEKQINIAEKNANSKNQKSSGKVSEGIKNEVARARREHTYNMEFFEENADTDDYGDQLEGEALNRAYEKWLKENQDRFKY